MYVKRIGSGGTSCFAIPGWGEDHLSFLPLEHHVAESAQLFAVDPPGYGDSPRAEPFNMDEVARLLVAAYEDSCTSAGSRLETIVGNCSGAILAAEVALRLEQPPARLVFIDPFAFLPGYFKVFLRRGFGRAAYQSTFANPVGRWITNSVLGGKKDHQTDMMSTFRVADHEVTYRYLQIFGNHDGIEQYGSYGGEVRILTGSRTFAAVRKSIGMWRELWPRAVVKELPGIGHLPIREAPAELVKFMLGTDQPVTGLRNG